ncbi:hypothetical protein SAMN04488556_3340 [Halostagnicola kamekurae]|uniref:Uncharacterized protein n=1 Tax=Halostagnicola kamekurae TaxID=619731 RepID=A0A1I6TR22_9EURY|nr:hypothetical protein SAMN04488556_3340 [Halostagnicola kamekurae]
MNQVESESNQCLERDDWATIDAIETQPGIVPLNASY